MDDQQMFDRQLGIFGKIIKYLFKVLIYTPLFFTGLIIMHAVFPKEGGSLFSLSVVLFLALALYMLVYFLKGCIVVLRYNGNILWILIFVICVGFTCILPVYIVFGPIGKILQSLSRNEQEQPVFTWIFSLAFGVYIYFRYDFLSNCAPAFAFPAYRAGTSFVLQTLNLVKSFAPQRSRDAV